MNLYVHFPFCRTKCTYCALHSRSGSLPSDRGLYVSGIAKSIEKYVPAGPVLETVYFGGGSPALCNLEPLSSVLAPRLAPGAEFTVELHPLDVTRDKLLELESLGVNRISMGVQSLDDTILRHMRRGYDFYTSERAFALVKEHFKNAGIDLIVGYPGEKAALTPRHARLAKWGLVHCSVYSLILEQKSILSHILGDSPPLPDDECVMNRISIISRFMREIGLERYEISNYAINGFECRHNMAVWRGEDYIGLGHGAHGREGLIRTQNKFWGQSPSKFWGQSPSEEIVSAEKDKLERKIFNLRTKHGLDLADIRWGQSPMKWRKTLDAFAEEGLLTRTGTVYRLTERGTEVCDSIMAELL